jgi:DNA-binding response OmpR family regulator
MTKTILIVEDEYDIAHTIEMLLIMESYQVICVTNGKEALNLLSQTAQKPDLIISDVMMPTMNGYDLAHALKANTELCQIPLMLMSAVDPDMTRLETGTFNVFIRKPFDLDLFLTSVSNLVSG